MANSYPLGTTHVPDMAPGELCLITIKPNGNLDVLRGPSPQDFNGEYMGVIREVDYSGNVPRIRAVFADPRITKSGIEIAKFDDREPPFSYTVQPRFRIQGVTNYNAFELGQPCVIQISDWDAKPHLLENPGMRPDEVRRLMPRELTGLWRGRVIFAMTTGYDVEGGKLYTIAAVLDDDRVTNHEDESVRRWAGLEVPVRYVVRRPGIGDAALITQRFLEDPLQVLTGEWAKVEDEAKKIFDQLTGK